MPRLRNTERELLTKTIAMLTRKAKDRTFAASILQGVLDDTNRLTIEGRLKVSQTATVRHAKEKAQQPELVASKKKAA
jgi:hypothetical protein